MFSRIGLPISVGIVRQSSTLSVAHSFADSAQYDGILAPLALGFTVCRWRSSFPDPAPHRFHCNGGPARSSCAIHAICEGCILSCEYPSGLELWWYVVL